MRTVNGTQTKEAAGTVGEFVENVFFPDCNRRLSTHSRRNYKNQWRMYLQPYISGLRLRDVRPHDIQNAFDGLDKDKGEVLSHDTFTLVKVCASAIFALALRLGHVASNPVIGTSIRGMGHTKHRENGAFSLDEIIKMTMYFEGQTLATVGICAFLGLRGPEIEALEPSDDEGENMHVHRHTKTGNGVRIPIIAPLRKCLAGWKGKINLRSEAAAIKEGCGKLGIRWRGMYAFRRGLGTTLHGLGVPAKVAALILRNSEEVCRRHYIKLDEAKEKTEAMGKLERVFESASASQKADGQRPQ